MTSGKEILDIVIGSHFSFAHHEEVKDDAEINLVGGFIQNLRDCADIWNDIEVPEQMRYALYVDEGLQELTANGWSVYAARMKGKRKVANTEGIWIWNAIAVLHGEPESVAFVDDQFFIYRPEIDPTPA